MKDANKLLSQSNNLDAEDFCDKVHALSSSAGRPENAIVNKKYKLNYRYSLAYEVLYSLLHRERHYGVADARTKPVTTAIVVTPEDSYYGILGVNENASQKEIEVAFKQKSKELQTDILEQGLRKQGFSDAEIKIRLEQAQRDYNNLREAYTGVGNEQNRRYYDEFREKSNKGYQQEQSQKTSSQKGSISAHNPANLEVLGVGPNPTQIEIRSAYRKLNKELHPDAYLSQLGKRREDLTPEEVKELNIREEKLVRVNQAYKEELDQRQLSREISEAKEKEQQEQDREKQSVIIQTSPTSEKSDITQKELSKTEKYRQNVENAGNIVITPEETAELKSRGVVPDDASSSEISANATTAVNLHAKGVGANKFSDAIDTAVDTNILTQEQGTSLQGAAFTLKAIEIENPKLTESLSIGNQEPSVSILQLPASVSAPQPNQIFLQNQGGGENYFQPILEGAVDKGKEFVEGKAEKAIVKGLEKKGVTTAAKSATKKVAAEALKKGGEQVIKQGAKVAAKAGLKTGIKAALVAAGAPTGGVSLLIWLAVEALELVLKVAKKLIGGLLKFITGKDDFKSQIKELAGIATAFFLATGMVVPAIISGTVFIASIGSAPITGAVVGVFHAVVFIVTTIILAVSWPIILSVFIFIFLVIFTIVVINNSAFVVPEGGFGYIGGSIPPGSLPGAVIGRCTDEEAGADITNQLASRIDSGMVNLLPTGANTNPWCIVPTMIILHSSAGYDNQDGSQRTYETLVSRNLACQFASDTNDVYLMQPFYENMVTMAWCANSWDAYGISIEISGEVPTPNPLYVECLPDDNLIFTDPPPHPCDPETDLTFSAVCESMQQYGIPWCQVWTHDDVPDATHTDPRGKEWVEYFINRLRNSCSTENDDQC